MREPVRHTVRGPAGQLVVWDYAGGAPATLLLHGIGNHGRVWDFVADAVAGRLRLIAPDARGHGESAMPTTGYAPTDFVADAIAILDGLGLLESLARAAEVKGGGRLLLGSS